MNKQNYFFFKRIFDLFLGTLISLILLFPLIIIALIVKFTSKGPVIYWSQRIGINNNLFRMPKFRTMFVNTPQVATHLLEDVDKKVTKVGKVLRTLSLDEFPQLYSIIRGDMCFVGPRPALFNQDDLIALRTKNKIHLITPGLTGWAQVSGRDELSIEEKVRLDKEYLDSMSLFIDLKILFITAFKVLRGNDVTH